jgi:hypothetical protein
LEERERRRKGVEERDRRKKGREREKKGKIIVSS